MLNKGDGTLAPKVDYDTGQSPLSVVAADINGDGKDDLVVANVDGNTVSVLRNNGNGTFGPRSDYSAGALPYSVTAADLNGDGKTDFAIASYMSDDVTLLLNNGDDTFSPWGASLPITDSQPISIAASDVNGDGRADLLVANEASDVVSVLLSTGDGTFAPKVDYDTGKNPRSVAIADLNRDDKPDLVVVNSGTKVEPGNTVSVLLNKGDATFAPKVDYTTTKDPVAVAVADLNGDGAPDLVVANSPDGSLTPGETVSVLLNSGNGTFGPMVDIAVGKNPNSVAIADLNGDGKPDLVVANGVADPASGYTVSVLLNKGGATFAPKVDYAAEKDPIAVAAADLNGDAKPDLAVLSRGAKAVSVRLNNGNATFGSKINYGTGEGPSSIIAGDLNGDKKLDLAVTNELSRSVTVLLNSGNGTFGTSSYRLIDFPVSIAIGDLNGDDKPDLATASYEDNTISILPNTCVP